MPLYKKVNKKYTGCNKTTEFHECALIGVCAVIRSNTVMLLPHAVSFGIYSLIIKQTSPFFSLSPNNSNIGFLVLCQVLRLS